MYLAVLRAVPAHGIPVEFTIYKTPPSSPSLAGSPSSFFTYLAFLLLRIVRRIGMAIKIHHDHRPRQRGIRKLHINALQPLETRPETRARKSPRNRQKPRIVDQFLDDGGVGVVFDARELDRAGNGVGRIARRIVELAGIVDGVLIEVMDATVRARMGVSKTSR